ncbi:protein of unknown function (plasmid) [Pararobbsia alpina]
MTRSDYASLHLKGGDHGSRSQLICYPRSVEQGEADRTEAAAKAKGSLGDSHKVAVSAVTARPPLV